jgi:MinD superfamily P-loop ATPase
VVAAVRGSDLVLLVTEPTPFGHHDLTLAVATLRALGLPLAVVVNRAVPGQPIIADYCRAEGLPLLAELPDDRRVAEAYSRGEPAVHALPELAARYRQLFHHLTALATASVALPTDA